MSIIRTQSSRNNGDHFEPDDASDPHVQRALRAALEQIDYTAYAANREVMRKGFPGATAQDFNSLGMAAAKARSLWVAAAVALSRDGKLPDAGQIAELARLRIAYDELSEAYEAMRRMVARGYITYAGA